MNAQAQREGGRRSYERRRCIKLGLPIPEWAALRQIRHGTLTQVQKDAKRRHNERTRCEKLGIPIPEWAMRKNKKGTTSLAQLECLRRLRERRRCVKLGLPIPEWAALRWRRVERMPTNAQNTNSSAFPLVEPGQNQSATNPTNNPMKDLFFAARTCPRCGADLAGGRTMSRFNTDPICLACAAAERRHPDYARACEAELAALKAGDRNFQGIGLPPDLARRP